jgi:ubiquinone/menaquinone biosynthesis C-methylase UbiE
MDLVDSNDIDMLKRGIMLPQYRMFCQFLDQSLSDDDRVMDLGCKQGVLCEVMDLMFSKDIEYNGIDSCQDNIDQAIEKNLQGNFKQRDYSKLRMRSSSFDIVIAQNSYFNHGDVFEKIDNLLRVSRKWVILFNKLVIPECEGYREVELENEADVVKIHGINYLKEIIEIMSPSNFGCSYVSKGDNPVKPTPSMFIIRV